MYTISFVNTYFKGYAQDFKDLLIIGALVHDIGKVDEMEYGVYKDCSIITHRILGLKYVEAEAEMIKAQYSEQWLHELEAIIVQHHDEFDDKARTVGAYVVHQADILDSRLTLLQQSVSHAVDDSVKIDGKYLEIFK
jgi:3'-5' exoribonuclease